MMGIKSKARKIIKKLNAKEKVMVPYPTDQESLLKGRTALVVGGSGGIGFEVAKSLLNCGATVVIGGTNKEKLERCIQTLNNARCFSFIFNLTDIPSISEKILEAETLAGSKIDILINCAGYNPIKNFWETDEEAFNRTFDINVKGLFFTCQAIANYMVRNKIHGHILNLSSSSALRPAFSPYEMSKWTIRGFTKGLADTLLPYGIVVNAIAPGPTATPMLGKSSSDDLDLPGNPSGRYATPQEIAHLATILVSSYGDLVVGDTLYATGGSGVISLHR